MDEEIKDEYLLDIQIPTSVTLNPVEQRVVDLVSRSVTGGIVMWLSISQLVTEVASYRNLRRQVLPKDKYGPR